MKEILQKIRAEALERISACDADLEALRVRYLGKKGELTAVLRGMAGLSAEERPVIGQLANQIRGEIENALAERSAAQKQKALEAQLLAERVDVTAPGNAPAIGHSHPLTVVRRDLEEIFLGLGFSIAEGPEVEYDYYNFQALNIPENHPARDTQDTFYITDNILLRSQTSPVQVRVMEKQKPPIRIILSKPLYALLRGWQNENANICQQKYKRNITRSIDSFLWTRLSPRLNFFVECYTSKYPRKAV